MRIRSFARDGVLPVEDLATGEALSILDRAIPVAVTGFALAARLCPLPGGIFATVGPLTPLDDAQLSRSRWDLCCLAKEWPIRRAAPPLSIGMSSGTARRKSLA
ncbi:MAG: hypothetical protein ACR2KT_00380 [Methylocella sp.]|nr:MAG: hypothetical protein DLM68_15430 [Hyphomicrobiales bacterium]